jgi:long-chain fatty acid transport protein
MMKKLIGILAVVGLLFASVSPLMAGGIINKQNLSADYFRSLTRHASTDAADIVAYNPAGVMKLENGLYTKLDLLYITKDYSNTVDDVYAFAGEDGTYTSDVPSMVPGFFTVYKKDKWAGFFSLTVPGGGGKVEYDEGNARTVQLATGIILANSPPLTPVQYFIGIDDMFLEADSVQLGYSLGGAFEISKMFSVAGGIRYVDATQSFAGYADMTVNPTLPPGAVPDRFEVDLERDATGWSYFLGVNIEPVDKVNIGLMYMSRTELEFSTDASKDDINVVGALGWDKDVREDLPAVLGLGVAYRPIEPLLCEFNYTRYLESQAALDDGRFEGSDEGDSYDLGLSVTYTINPQWRASLGYMYTNIVGMEKESLLTEAPELDANTIGLGVVFSPTDRWDFTLGYTDVTYDSETTEASSSRAPEDTELAKDVWAVSLGLQYRFF